MFVRRVLVGSSGLGIVGTGLWFLISHLKETRNRNWANGLIEDVKKLGVITENKKSEEIWDLEAIKWDGCSWEYTWKDSSKNVKNDFKSLEEAKIAFFTNLEKFKTQNGLMDAFGPTSYADKFAGNLDEFIWQKDYFTEDCKQKKK